MAIDGHENFLSMGRSWPSEHKNLCKYVAHWRPKLEVD
jgi:hypothetical protein